jgi:two-component system OmpR family response regulator
MAGGRCRILVVEDDRETADQLKDSLSASGYHVDLAVDGREGLSRGRSAEYAVMTVDRMLPDIDGLAVIRRLREAGIVTPALIVSALGEIDDRVRGLRAGGDDYLVKPFAIAELLARVDALARRSDTVVKETLLRVGDLTLDLVSRTVTRSGREIALLPREFQVLEYLVRNEGQVVPRAMLLQHVWDLHFRSHDQHHRRLCRACPPQSRRPPGLSADPYRPRCWVLCPCSWLRPYGHPRFDWP